MGKGELELDQGTFRVAGSFSAFELAANICAVFEKVEGMQNSVDITFLDLKGTVHPKRQILSFTQPHVIHAFIWERR